MSDLTDIGAMKENGDVLVKKKVDGFERYHQRFVKPELFFSSN